MKLVVLAAADSWYYRDLVRAAGGRHEVVVRSFAELRGSTLGASNRIDSNGHDLVAADAVMVRTMPPGSLEQVVFRMDALGRLEAAGVPVINSPRALETAVDKYLATSKLAAAGLLTPRTIVCQTVDDALRAFDDLGGDVVLKPLFGGEGRGITRVSDVNLALRAFQMLAQINAVMYIQEFIAHAGFDLRLFVLGGRIFGMKRINPHDWRTNVSRGASTAPLEVTEELATLAFAASRAVGTLIAGVDILPARDGRLYVLEVNAVPGWKALGRTLDIDVAALVLDCVTEQLTHPTRSLDAR